MSDAHRPDAPAGTGCAPGRKAELGGSCFPDNRFLHRLQQLAADIHLLGERALYELFHELAQGADLFDTLERYAQLVPLAEHIIRQPPRRPRLHLCIAGVSA
jgi:hypothetical protein